MAFSEEKSAGETPDAARLRWQGKIANLAPSELEAVFLRAVTQHDVMGVGVLLEAKSEFFRPELGRGLQISAEKGYSDLVEIFLKNGAEADWMAGLPLRLAVENGHREAAWLLVKAGANEHRSDGALVNHAAGAGQTGMMEWLFARGVKGDLMNALNTAAVRGQESAVDLILSRIKPDDLDSRAYNAAYQAIEKGHDGIARKLIERGYHKRGDTELIFEAVLRRMDAPLLEFFLEREPRPPHLLRRPIGMASQVGAVDCLRVLLNEGGSPHAIFSGHDSVTPIFNEAASQEPIQAKERARALYPEGGYTLEKLRAVGADGTNGFLLMTLAGRWDELRQYIITHRDEPVYASDFSAPNHLGRSVIGVLGRAKNLGSLFDPAVWEGRSAQTMASTLRLVPPRFHADIGHCALVSEANRRVLDDMMGPRRKRGPNP